MKYSIKVVFIKQNPKDKNGTLYIRVIKNRQQKRKTLGINLTHAQWNRYFDESKNKFRENKAYPLYLEYNQLIEVEIEKLKSQLRLPDNGSEKPSSLIEFWKRQIKFTEKHGTRGKHQVVLNKLKKFLVHKNLIDLPFNQITPELIEEIQYYFKTAKDPRSLAPNSQNQYLKMIRSVITKSKKKRTYTYSYDPFDAITYNKTQPKEKIVLEKEELLRIAKTKFEDQNIRTARNIFLFQVFSNGMRIGDVIRLQWKNVTSNSIKYEMMKNGKELTYPMNINLSKLILKTLKKEKLISKALIEEEMAIHDKFGFKEFLKSSGNKMIREQSHRIEQTPDGYFLIKHYIWHIFVWYKVSKRMNSFYSKLGVFDGGLKEKALTTELINSGKLITHHGFQILADDEELIEIINLLERFKSKAERKLKALALEEVQKQKGNEFVFGVLNFEEFKTLKKWENITEKQYKHIKNKSIVINRRLKVIQKKCEISKNLTTHVARHTFANLLLQMDNINTSDLSATLGHSSLAITDKYVDSGFNKNKHDEINNQFSNEIRI